MSFTFDPAGTPIAIRSPDIGDTLRIQSQDIRRASRGGDFLQTVDSNWPYLRFYAYSFSLLTSAEITSLNTFIEANAGTQITITDHHGTTMTGYITSPINETVRVRPTCSNSLTIEFMQTPV